jgi:hypothetical protein
MGAGRNACEVLVGQPDGRSQRERHRRRYENNIKIDVNTVI